LRRFHEDSLHRWGWCSETWTIAAVQRVVDGEAFGHRGAQSFDGARPAITGRRRVPAASGMHASAAKEMDRNSRRMIATHLWAGDDRMGLNVNP
jgi:hypothetical protein